jgi:PAS domain S-box-containing protein
VKAGKSVYLVAFHPLPEEECVTIYGFDISDQRELEEKLLESEEKYRNIIETANEGILIVDTEFRATYINKKIEEMLGYSQEEMIGKSERDFTDEEGKAISSLVRKNIRQGIKEPCEFRLIGKGGSSIWALVSTKSLLDKSGKFIGSLAMITDITKRKKAEESLRLSSIYNRSLVEASLDPLVTIGPDGKITDVNGATEQVTGYSKNELIGTDFSDYFTEPEKARAGYQNVFKDGEVRDYPLEIRHRDGHITPVL